MVLIPHTSQFISAKLTPSSQPSIQNSPNLRCPVDSYSPVYEMHSLQALPSLNLPVFISPSIRAHRKFNNNPNFFQMSLAGNRTYGRVLRAVSVADEEFLPNATQRKKDPQWRGGFSLGVDLGLSRTGLALSKGFSVRPLTEADEFIIGLPKSCDGKETTQSNKVRSVAGRLAVRAAERGWRVYLLDEHGTSAEATDRMINLGLNKSARQTRTDAYSAVILLERYFSLSGQGSEIILPKNEDLQEKLRKGAPKDVDVFPEELEE